jgi:hypothetical protein
MRGTKAKKIRKIVYGNEYSPRHRKYWRHEITGQIISDDRRREYQKTKKDMRGL